MIQAIIERRSIRKYKNISVPQPMIEEVIKAGMLAPSSKNRQPWNFIVVSGGSKSDMLNTMKKGFERERIEPLLPDSVPYISGAKYTLGVMEQAPVIIFIMNTLGVEVTNTLTTEDRISEICNAQSIGAAIENMTLAATELGLGSLWICDTFFAQEELRNWLHTKGELYAALAIGYPNETPFARPRYDMKDVVEWRS